MSQAGEGDPLAGWIRRVLEGDREAYAEVVAATQRQVWAMLAGYCRSAEETEEFCHLAFVEAYFRLSQYSPERGSFLSWLMTIARSRLLNEIHRRQAEGERSLRYLERAAAERAPFEDLEGARHALEHCLSELAPEEADLVRGRYGERRTSEQLGARLGKTGVAVRRFMQRIRERLRMCVEARLARGEV